MTRDITRRDAIRATGASIGALLLATSGVLAACGRDTRRATNGVLTADQQDLAEEIADTLLPTTPASPGAKAAGAGAAMNLLLTDCYPEDAQRRVVTALDEILRSDRQRGRKWADFPRPDREDSLRRMDTEAKHAADPATHWFTTFRELALRAYFTSEVGMTKALRFTMVPGKWVGCTPLQPGQPAWG